MPAKETVSIDVRAELKALQADLQKAGNLTEGQAQKMIIGVEKRVQAAERAAKSLEATQRKSVNAAREAEKAAAAAASAADKRAGGAIKALEKLGALGGGPLQGVTGGIGDLADMFEGASAAGGGAAIAAGAAAAAFLAIGVAVVGGASAIHGFIGSADPLIARLKEIEGSEGLPPATIEALDEYRQSSLGAEVAASRLHVTVSGLAAGAFEPAMDALGGLLIKVNDFAEGSGGAMVQVLQDISEAGQTMLPVVTLGGSKVASWALGLDDLGSSGRDAARDLRDTAAAGHEAAKGIDATKEAADRAKAALDGAKFLREVQEGLDFAGTGAGSAVTAAFQQAERIQQAAADKVNGLELQSGPWYEAMSADIERQAQSQIDAIMSAAKVADAKPKSGGAGGKDPEIERLEAAARAQAEHSAAVKAAANEDARVLMDAQATAAAMMDAYIEQQRTAGEAVEARVRREIAAIQTLPVAIEQQEALVTAAKDQGARDQAEIVAESGRALMAQLDVEIAKSEAVAAAVKHAQADLALSIVDGVGQLADAFGGLVEEGSDAHKALFVASQLAGLAQVGVATGVGIANALLLPPPAVPFAVAGAIATGAVAAATVGAATITGLDSMASGGFPDRPDVYASGGWTGPSDHFPVLASDGEAFINRRGTRMLGPEGVDALNRGQAPGGTAVSVTLKYGPKALGTVLADTTKSDKGLRRTIRKSGAVAGHKR